MTCFVNIDVFLVCLFYQYLFLSLPCTLVLCEAIGKENK